MQELALWIENHPDQADTAADAEQGEQVAQRRSAPLQ